MKPGRVIHRFEVEASPAEAQRLADAAALYASAWQWSFDQFGQSGYSRFSGDSEACKAHRMLVDEVPYGLAGLHSCAIRHGWQAGWCALHRKGESKLPPTDVVHCRGDSVRVRGADVLAAGAMFRVDPVMPDRMRVTSLRLWRDGDAWRGIAMGFERPAGDLRAPAARKNARQGVKLAAGARSRAGAVGG